MKIVDAAEQSAIVATQKRKQVLQQELQYQYHIDDHHQTYIDIESIAFLAPYTNFINAGSNFLLQQPPPLTLVDGGWKPIEGASDRNHIHHVASDADQILSSVSSCGDDYHDQFFFQPRKSPRLINRPPTQLKDDLSIDNIDFKLHDDYSVITTTAERIQESDARGTICTDRTDLLSDVAQTPLAVVDNTASIDDQVIHNFCLRCHY